LSNVKELVGIEFAPYSFEIEKGKIREFVAAIGDQNPIYYDLEAAQKEGFERIPIPLTFLQVVDSWGGYNFQQKMERMKLNPVRVLHGEQSFELIDDIYAGDKLNVEMKIVNVDVKTGSTGGMDLITTENHYRNKENKLVAISQSVLVHRH
jgi:hypothetical protein